MSRTSYPAARLARCLWLVGALGLLTACATSTTTDNELRRETARSIGLAPERVEAADAQAIAQRVGELLAGPLAREDAVTLALLNNPSLARRWAELRIDAAERVRASRPPNPALHLARLQRGDERETERGVSIDLLGLLAWPATRGAANRHYEAARQSALRDALLLARDTRLAWTGAVAAGAKLAHARATADAAGTARLYAERLAAAGNASALAARRAQAFDAEAGIALARAQADAAASREALVRLLGLADDGQLQLPASLPDLPAQPVDEAATSQRAIDERTDVKAARLRADATARSLRLARTTRVINVLETGYQSNRSNQAPTQTGFEVTLELPLFDFGSARTASARARWEAAVADVTAVALRAQSQTREAWLRYRTSHDIATRYRDEVLPVTAAITREMILRHNGMLVGPFELIDQAHAQAGATARWQAALRDFWIADAQLAAVLQGAGDDAPADYSTPSLAPPRADAH